MLQRAGFAFTVVIPQVDETPRPGEEPGIYANRIAREKCERVAGQHPGAIVMAADTVVALDGDILGKPLDKEDAARTLARLSGRVHEVITAVYFRGSGKEIPLDARTRVEFAELTSREIGDYVESGEPMDKAGAYAIQGGGEGFVRRIEGSYTNVIGLPLREVIDTLTSQFDVFPTPTRHPSQDQS